MIFLVVDVNVVISALLGVGDSYGIFARSRKEQKFWFITPEFLLVELNKHSSETARRTNFSLEEAQIVSNFISKKVIFVNEYFYEEKVEEARTILRGHEKDAPYLALALTMNCNILSGDKTFKRLCPDKVKNPKEILQELNK